MCAFLFEHNSTGAQNAGAIIANHTSRADIERLAASSNRLNKQTKQHCCVTSL